MTRIRASAAALSTCALLFWAAPAVAADGEILINQGRVNSGAITPGDGPGFPALLSRPGRYKLNGNLRVPADQNGIEVTASDVTIDLNGFAIISDPPRAASGGVFIRDGDRVRVINGTLSDFKDFGIYLAGGVVPAVENMRIIACGGIFYGALYSGRQARIRNNTIVNSTTTAIVDCIDCLIEQNLITGGVRDGISQRGGAAIGNVIVGNDRFGIEVSTLPAKAGYGLNILVGNNSAGFNGGTQVLGAGFQLHPNVCEPNCP